MEANEEKNERQARLICGCENAKKNGSCFEDTIGCYKCELHDNYITAMAMANWKDKNNKERKLLLLLLEAINYSFLQTDGTYDNKLTYPVIDKITYVYSQLNLDSNDSDVNNKIGYLKK